MVNVLLSNSAEAPHIFGGGVVGGGRGKKNGRFLTHDTVELQWLEH